MVIEGLRLSQVCDCTMLNDMHKTTSVFAAAVIISECQYLKYGFAF